MAKGYAGHYRRPIASNSVSESNHYSQLGTHLDVARKQENASQMPCKQNMRRSIRQVVFVDFVIGGLHCIALPKNNLG